MQKYKIAGLRVDMNIRYNHLKNQAEKYLTNEDSDADITINLSDEFINQRHNEHQNLDIEAIEYVYYGSYFYNKILQYNGFLLHSSAICKDNQAYLFSANSGTGKSTHTNNWIKYFGKDNITYINDDKPAIRKIDGKFYCCGTPFSGKTDLSNNIIVPIKAIIFIVRGKNNSMRNLSIKEAINRIFAQTVYSLPEEKMNVFLSLLNDLLVSIPIYELTCNMDVSSAYVAYEYINKQ